MKKNIFMGCCLILTQSTILTASQSIVVSPNLPHSKQTQSVSSSSSATSTEVKRGGVAGQDTQSNANGSESSDQLNHQEQMPAWMLESAQTAKDYVNDLDQGLYSQSWSKADPLFQKTMNQNDWVKILEISRKNLGRVKTRTIKLQRPAWDPKGLPKGLYMVIEYETSFEKNPQGVELLTLRRGEDNKWRVLTYQVN